MNIFRRYFPIDLPPLNEQDVIFCLTDGLFNPLTLREAKTDLTIWEISYFIRHSLEKNDGEMFL